jgi:hypothetical protein
MHWLGQRHALPCGLSVSAWGACCAPHCWLVAQGGASVITCDASVLCCVCVHPAGSVDRLYKRFGEGLAWYVPLGIKAWFTSRGIHNVTELDWWHEVQHPGSKVRQGGRVKDFRIKSFQSPGCMARQLRVWDS